MLAEAIDDWYVTVLRQISGYYARLHPGSSNLEPVLASLARLGPRLTASSVPNDAVLAEADLGRVVDGAWTILDNHALHLGREERALLEQALHGFEMDAATGTTLLNGNLDPRNILLSPAGVHLLDWGRAATEQPGSTRCRSGCTSSTTATTPARPKPCSPTPSPAGVRRPTRW
ncbi:hypothetical protein ACFQ0B_75735 [Nonomuraea thailandensis]